MKKTQKHKDKQWEQYVKKSIKRKRRELKEEKYKEELENWEEEYYNDY